MNPAKAFKIRIGVLLWIITLSYVITESTLRQSQQKRKISRQIMIKDLKPSFAFQPTIADDLYVHQLKTLLMQYESTFSLRFARRYISHYFDFFLNRTRPC